MKIINSVNDKTVELACNIVMQYYHSPAFYQYIQDERFNGQKLRNVIYGDEVHAAQLSMNHIVYVKPYKTFNPWSRVIGHARGDTIFVNTRKLDLSLEDRVINIRHELYHLEGFKHPNNSPTEFDYGTVPYKGGVLFAKFLKSIGVLE